METCPVCQVGGVCVTCKPGDTGAKTVVSFADASQPAPKLPTPSPIPHKGQPRLVVLRGEAPGVAFPLLAGRNTLGRAGDRPVDIELSGQEHVERTWTSRQHACVRVEAGHLYVEDLMSLNGTFLNGSRVHPGQPRPVRPGDILQVGTVQMRLELA